MNKVYFDNNATTPVHEEVVEVMLPYLKEEWGNPSSIHWAGRGPKKGVEDAREQVAALFGSTPAEIIFTGSGSESNNLAIKGVAYGKKAKGRHLITTKVEHPSVLGTFKFLEREGFEVTWLDVDSGGIIDLDQLRSAIRKDTALISIMYANNETGVLSPVKEIGVIAKEHKVPFHTDAVQAAGKFDLNVKEMGCDLLTISGHKIYAPKGVAALFVKRGVRLVPLIHGGHHERNRRGGTENVASIVGFGKACEIAVRDIATEFDQIKKLRDRLEEGLVKTIPHSFINGDHDKRLPTTANISFEYVEGESLLLSLDMLGVAASSGSACTSGSLEPSHVLLAMGVKVEASHGSLRFSLGRFNTDEEVDYVLDKLPAIVDKMRSMSPLWDAKTGEPVVLDFEKKGHA